MTTFNSKVISVVRVTFSRIGLLLFFLLPPLLHRHLGASSFAAGLVLASLIVIAAELWRTGLRSPKKPLISSFTILCSILLLSGYSIAFGPYTDVAKSLSTAVALFFCFWAASILIQKSQPTDYFTVLWVLLATQIFAGLLGLLSVLPTRTSLVFNEPSHFGLFVLPLVAVYAFNQEKISRVMWMMVAMSACVVFFRSAIVLSALAMGILFLGVRGRLDLRVWIALLVCAIPLTYMVIENQDYLAARLNFESEGNATSLTLVAAYQRLGSIWEDYTLFGIGLQNFGNYPINSPAFDILERIDGRIGRNDGAVTFAKLGAEFGVLMIAIPLAALFRILPIIRRSSFQTSVSAAFALALLIELFVRGVGYFSPTFLIGTAVVFKPSLMGSGIAFKSASSRRYRKSSKLDLERGERTQNFTLHSPATRSNLQTR